MDQGDDRSIRGFLSDSQAQCMYRRFRVLVKEQNGNLRYPEEKKQLE
jgi:hypothetical protein